MRNLLLFLNEVESFWQDRIILVLVLAYLDWHFNHILNEMADDAFV